MLDAKDVFMKIRCSVEGLDCAHCASNLETLLARDADIISAEINFALGLLVMEAADGCDEDAIVEKANGIAAGFEDGINIELRD